MVKLKEMLLPDLSSLNIGNTLFDHLAKRGGGKDSCNFHEDHLVPPDERDNSEYEPPEDDPQNCATEGYLMYKPINVAEGPVGYKPNEYNGKTITVATSRETGSQEITLQPLLRRGATLTDRVSYFKKVHKNWIEEVFPMTCKRPGGLLSITWDRYGETLLEHSEWYYIDPQNRGHLFISVVDNITRRKKLHLPELNVGYFDGNFIYVVLVCAQAGAGVGKTMLSAADAVASKLGVQGVSLASLSNSAGAYFNSGYKFVSKWDGMEIDVEGWVEEVQQPNGQIKRVLNTTAPHGAMHEHNGTKRRGEDDTGREDTPTPRTEKAEQSEDEEDAEDAYRLYLDERSRLKRLLDDTLERARNLYRQLSALSYEIA
jgi:hypothetical protein